MVVVWYHMDLYLDASVSEECTKHILRASIWHDSHVMWSFRLCSIYLLNYMWLISDSLFSFVVWFFMLLSIQILT
jgi:hypothetical protein